MYFDCLSLFAQSVLPEQIGIIIGYVVGLLACTLILALIIAGLLHLFSIIFNNPRFAFKKVFALVFGVAFILAVIFTFTEKLTQSVPPEQISFMIGYITGVFLGILILASIISGLLHLFSIILHYPRLAFNKVFTIVFGIVFILVVLSTFTKRYDNPRKIPANFDYGNWIGSTYKNDFFGLSITIPEDWHIVSKDELNVLTQAAQNADFVDTDEMKRIFKVAEITVANLFMACRYTEEEAMEEAGNPSIILIAENISLPGRKINKTQYANAVSQNLAKGTPGSTIKPAINKMIANKEFVSLQTETFIEEISFCQENLIYIKNDFALLFVLTWLDDSEKSQLDDIMATLTLD